MAATAMRGLSGNGEKLFACSSLALLILKKTKDNCGIVIFLVRVTTRP